MVVERREILSLNLVTAICRLYSFSPERNKRAKRRTREATEKKFQWSEENQKVISDTVYIFSLLLPRAAHCWLVFWPEMKNNRASTWGVNTSQTSRWMRELPSWLLPWNNIISLAGFPSNTPPHTIWESSNICSARSSSSGRERSQTVAE